LNAEGKNDGGYTPESKKQWNSEKYSTKLMNLNQVLASIDSNGGLIGVGLCEVENERVVLDLIASGFLAERDFKLVHEESPDFRGIDVAFIYDPKVFEYKYAEWIRVDLPDTHKTTRDILRVTGKVWGKELTVLVNHWPSRWGGTEKSNPKRVAAAQSLRSHLDTMRRTNEHGLIIMGDFNDYPNNESISKVLGADSVSPGKELYNATWNLHKIDSIGSHNYRGHWGMLDQMIVSSNWVETIDTVYVHKRNCMCYQNKKGEWLPSRSFSGGKYYAGYSDHLPVVLKFKKQ
jgi:hypothetical protein